MPAPVFGMLVHLHHADGAVDATLRIATEREVGDVDVVAAEQRADVADDARLVVVLDDEERAFERRFNADAIYQHQAQAAVREDRAFDPTLARSSVCSFTEMRLV